MKDEEEWISISDSDDAFMNELINSNGFIKFSDGNICRWNDEWIFKHEYITHYKLG